MDVSLSVAGEDERWRRAALCQGGSGRRSGAIAIEAEEIGRASGLADLVPAPELNLNRIVQEGFWRVR